ncbi:MAG: phosphoglycerate kinase [Rhodospirillaceae bacterium]|nr:phosphoglycerate kinase [Rhodospirillaceae bacterium]MYB13947.1 phosphoglycerate kinase [Rhodospirillaceae bacterium]MYI49994.1 phosphoglycerate kinase [Rhodospirillaceae bacterium]
MTLPRIEDMEVAGKRLLVRADLNVPVEQQRVTDATRIDRFAAGMRPLLARGARLVILTHYGRPDPALREPELSVERLCPALAEALGVPVRFAASCTGREAVALSAQLADGEALLCENLRFDAGETANDPAFAAELAKLGDIYVNDAFSCAHRAHASIVAVASLLPAAAGPLLAEELRALNDALEAPRRPSVAIVGGAKVSTKIAVLKNLVRKLDAVIVGGGMANTFLLADGVPVGRSLSEPDHVSTVQDIRRLAAEADCRIVLPVDIVTARELSREAAGVERDLDACPPDEMILDAGALSIDLFNQEIALANTLLWNGPLGAFEYPAFARATIKVAEHTAFLSKFEAVCTVAGGGDTVAALNAAGVADDFTYVSAAGGAFLEWLEGRTLPGIAALVRANNA